MKKHTADDYRREYQRWIDFPELDPKIRDELESVSDEDEISDRFYKPLSFGTGGLRGILGAGINRMNIYTVAKATQGLANYINSCSCHDPSVVIAYDSRINSRLFAETTAQVLAGNSITAYVFPRLAPTPLLSFAVRELCCTAGVCITASHNPAEYNGYKVYGSDGCQITTEAAAAVQAEIDTVDVLDCAKQMSKSGICGVGLIRDVPETVVDHFIESVARQAMPVQAAENTPLHIVYTPLNGAGKECVLRILKQIALEQVTVVPCQEQPDGRFPTCPYPNPEESAALAEGLRLCKTVHPDLLLATDPDCDRVGVAVAEDGDYRLLSGNEMGVLLFDYICGRRLAHDRMPERPVAVTTIVSTDMADAVAARYGVELRRTLTGFKFIGEQIGILEAAGEAQRYIFGFEESCGYLSGVHVRDKDAVNASMLICQMAQYYKAKGLTLAQAMSMLYEQYGFYQSQLLSFFFQGEAGIREIALLMNRLRREPPKKLAGEAVIHCTDYTKPNGNLPKSDVLSFEVRSGNKVIIRPSGTEPKLKAYLFVSAETKELVQVLLERLAMDIKGIIATVLNEQKAYSND